MKFYEKNNMVKAGILAVLVLAVISITIINKGSSNDGNATNTNEAVSQEEAIQSKNTKEDSSNITQEEATEEKTLGLNPADVYLNMEDQGFVTEKDLGGSDGNIWESKKTEAGIEYYASVFGYSATDAVEYRATTTILDPQNKTIEATRSFMTFAATVPYEGSNPEKLSAWVDENFNNDKESTTIGSAKITLHAPTDFYRAITFEVSE